MDFTGGIGVGITIALVVIVVAVVGAECWRSRRERRELPVIGPEPPQAATEATGRPRWTVLLAGALLFLGALAFTAARGSDR